MLLQLPRSLGSFQALGLRRLRVIFFPGEERGEGGGGGWVRGRPVRASKFRVGRQKPLGD